MKLITFQMNGNVATGYIDSEDAVVCSERPGTNNDDSLESSGQIVRLFPSCHNASSLLTAPLLKRTEATQPPQQAQER